MGKIDQFFCLWFRTWKVRQIGMEQDIMEMLPSVFWLDSGGSLFICIFFYFSLTGILSFLQKKKKKGKLVIEKKGRKDGTFGHMCM